MIDKYFDQIEQILEGSDQIERVEIYKQKINNVFGIIEGKLFFESGILDFIEVVRILENNKISKKKYKYHFRHLDNSIVFRYDNMPHYPKISTFPHHKHIGTSIKKSEEPELILILKEIEKLVNK